MAKIERRVKGNIFDILKIESAVMSGSVSASYEDGSNTVMTVLTWRCAFTNVTLYGPQPGKPHAYARRPRRRLFLERHYLGRKSGRVFKINRWGENAFLDDPRRYR